MEKIEEGIVVEKGARTGAMFGAIIGAIGMSDTSPAKGYYWAKVKVPGFDRPLLIKSKYNFSKGTKVRVRYSPNRPEDAELVVDWK